MVLVRAFDNGSVRLRACFTLNLVKLLPSEWDRLLDDQLDPAQVANLENSLSIALSVDLFRVPDRLRCAERAFELVERGATIAEMARRLGLPETSANRAFRAGKMIAERGIKDPYEPVYPEDTQSDVSAASGTTETCDSA